MYNVRPITSISTRFNRIRLLMKCRVTATQSHSRSSRGYQAWKPAQTTPRSESGAAKIKYSQLNTKKPKSFGLVCGQQCQQRQPKRLAIGNDVIEPVDVARNFCTFFDAKITLGVPTRQVYTHLLLSLYIDNVLSE
jgi:hypothetical protein